VEKEPRPGVAILLPSLAGIISEHYELREFIDGLARADMRRYYAKEEMKEEQIVLSALDTDLNHS
jgi:hypothetical protein